MSLTFQGRLIVNSFLSTSPSLQGRAVFDLFLREAALAPPTGAHDDANLLPPAGQRDNGRERLLHGLGLDTDPRRLDHPAEARLGVLLAGARKAHDPDSTLRRDAADRAALARAHGAAHITLSGHGGRRGEVHGRLIPCAGQHRARVLLGRCRIGEEDRIVRAQRRAKGLRHRTPAVFILGAIRWTGCVHADSAEQRIRIADQLKLRQTLEPPVQDVAVVVAQVVKQQKALQLPCLRGEFVQTRRLGEERLQLDLLLVAQPDRQAFHIFAVPELAEFQHAVQLTAPGPLPRIGVRRAVVLIGTAR